MIIAVLVRFNHVDQKARKIVGVGRSSDLIGHDLQRIVRLANVQHRLDEVLAVDAEDPGNAHDEVLVQISAYRKLAFELGLTVDVQRLVVLTVRFPWLRALSVEDVVR